MEAGGWISNVKVKKKQNIAPPPPARRKQSKQRDKKVKSDIGKKRGFGLI
jgi:hypothetical protein